MINGILKQNYIIIQHISKCHTTKKQTKSFHCVIIMKKKIIKTLKKSPPLVHFFHEKNKTMFILTTLYLQSVNLTWPHRPRVY